MTTEFVPKEQAELDFLELTRCYEMGKDCALNGPNETNCHFTLFRSPKHTKAWEEGKNSLDGQQCKAVGMKKAAKKHHEDLVKAQYLAYILAERGAPITIEDVRNEWAKRGLAWNLQNATGSVFRDIGLIKWEVVGYRPAKRPEAHARMIRLWRLKK